MRNHLGFVLLALALAGCRSIHPAGPREDPTLASLRALLEDARAAEEAELHAEARERIADGIDRALEETANREDESLLRLLVEMGDLAHDTGEFRSAEAARRRVLEARSRVLDDDHPDLQAARQNLAITLNALGDLAGSHALFEKVLEIRTRTLPDDHADLQMARQNFANAIFTLGDIASARALQEKVLDVYSRTLPADHRELQRARGNLAGTLFTLGDLAGALALQEVVLEVLSRTLPADHPDLQRARGNIAVTIKNFGDLERARALEEQVLDVRSRTLPGDHPELQRARQNLAVTMKQLGDFDGARALEEQVLEVRLRTLPDDHPDLQAVRGNLASTIKLLGEVAEARTLEAKVLEVRSRMLPEDHPALVRTRGNLANTMYLLGDLAGARALQEQVLEVRLRTLPDDHPELQGARQNLSATLKELGDFSSARVLDEQVLEVRSRSLPDDHSDLQGARLNLAGTKSSLGDFEGAREMEEQVLEVFSRTLPDDHPDVQGARQNLGTTLLALGDAEGACGLLEEVLEVRSRTRVHDHPDVQVSRQNLAVAIARRAASGAASEGPGKRAREKDLARQRCASLLLEGCRAQADAARHALLESSSREAESRCMRLAQSLDLALSFAAGYGIFDPIPELDWAAFELGETTRGAALCSAALMRQAADSPKYRELRESLRLRSDHLVDLARQGTTSEGFLAALSAREETEREIVNLARDPSGGLPPGLEFDADALAASLAEDEAVVAFRRYEHWRIGEGAWTGPDASSNAAARSTQTLCALVLRKGVARTDRGREGGQLTRVHLGPVEQIEQAVRAWRSSLGVGEDERGVSPGAPVRSATEIDAQGRVLRRLLFDPIGDALGSAERVVIVLDDVLHVVPLDCLPTEDSTADGAEVRRLGDGLRLETRLTLAELLTPARARDGAGMLVAVGGVTYEAASEADLAASGLEAKAEDAVSPYSAARREDEAGILRGSSWSIGFRDLPATGLEARTIASDFAGTIGTSDAVTLLEGKEATRERLFEKAGEATWLHIATHGWFAPESIRSWEDPGPLDMRSGLMTRLSAEEQVRGMSPMLLCGLALAGANLPANPLGRVPGLLTAEELSTLDLTHCELAVLSACDTNVGERRAGQGVASLQRALQMAGASSVITSLWRVPDEATRELMTDFYRRIWVEKKPKWQALWEAKKGLREAKDERGQPKYSTCDWATWVLTGEPE